MPIRQDFNQLLDEDIMFRAFFETLLEKEPTQEIVNNTPDLKLKEIYGQYQEELKELKVRERNSEFFDDIVNWNDPTPQNKSDLSEFRRELYSNIVDTIYSLDLSGLKYGNEIYNIYFISKEFKWYNRDYTIYANGRNKRKDELGINFNQQLNNIASAVYHDVKQADINPETYKWEGKLVGNEVAVDISIKWEANRIKSIPTSGSVDGLNFKTIIPSEDYIKIFKVIKESINRRSLITNDYSAIIDYYFNVENVTVFLNRFDQE